MAVLESHLPETDASPNRTLSRLRELRSEIGVWDHYRIWSSEEKKSTSGIGILHSAIVRTGRSAVAAMRDVYVSGEPLAHNP